MIETDICIIGAGPGGSAAALKLHRMGIPCVLIDKATFPRDKICGDALSGKVLTVLNRIDPELMDDFTRSCEAIDTWGVKFVAPNETEMDIPFMPSKREHEDKSPGFVAKRIDFDNFLVDEVRKCDTIDFHEGVKMTAYIKVQGGYELSDASGALQIKTTILIDSSGAHSIFSRKYGGIKKEDGHYAGAVRAYYEGVDSFTKGNFVELHFVKDFIPGYFWIFPLANGGANVGLGMLTKEISKRKVNLKKEMYRIIEEHPKFKARFKNAKQVGKLEGFGLPFGSKVRKLSGDHYMLVGDAASLIDPLTGEGIGNAVFSGYIAAEQARDCLANNDFSEKYLRAYDKRVYRVMGKEFKISYTFQRLLRIPPLFNFVANRTVNNKQIQKVLGSAFIDVDLRGKLRNPIFWLKMIFNMK